MSKSLGIAIESYKKNIVFQSVAVFTMAAIFTYSMSSIIKSDDVKVSASDKKLSNVLIKTGDTETVVDKSTANVGPAPLIGSAAYNNANHVPMKEKISQVKTSLFQTMHVGVNAYKEEKIKNNAAIISKMDVIKPSSENASDTETRNLMNE